jgi:hypothetical protein
MTLSLGLVENTGDFLTEKSDCQSKTFFDQSSSSVTIGGIVMAKVGYFQNK